MVTWSQQPIRWLHWLVSSLLLAGGVGFAATTNDLWDFGAATQRIEDLNRVSAYLSGLAREPLPRGLNDQDRTESFVFTQWLRNASRKMHHLSRGWSVLLSRVPKGEAQNRALIERLQEMNRSFSVQYLDMVALMQKEVTQFTWSSDELRERHERAMNLLRTLQ
jgi:hypothetical protein